MEALAPTRGTVFAKSIAKERCDQAKSRLDHHERMKDLDAAFGIKAFEEDPTPERIAKGGILKPVTSQTEKRKNAQALDAFQMAGARKSLDGDEVRAGQKFAKHYQGSIGIDVRETDEWSGMNDLDGIPPTTYHGQKIAEARDVLSPIEFNALVYMTETGATLEMVGIHVIGRTSKHAAPVALQCIQGALYRLIDLWGLSSGNQRYRPPSR